MDGEMKPRSDQTQMLLDEIRVATSGDHAALEAQLPLMRDDLTIDTYRSVVERFLGFIGPFEQKVWSIEALEAAGMKKDVRGKTHLLERDLSALGHSSESIQQLPRSTELPEISDLQMAIGSLYVVEGSTLGGQIISRHLKSKLKIDNTSGAAYFGGYGRLTGKRWKEYLGCLSSLELDARRDTAIEAARSTFGLLRSWLCIERGS